MKLIGLLMCAQDNAQKNTLPFVHSSMYTGAIKPLWLVGVCPRG